MPESTDKTSNAKKKRTARYEVPPSEQVLVALMNNKRDWQIARAEHWYRIPVRTAPRIVQTARYIAFYQTKLFGEEGWAVNYWAEIRARPIVTRLDLFPREEGHVRRADKYYRLELGEIGQLEQPIISRRGRRLVFLPTTLAKFRAAREIDDLFHESPLEDDLWQEFRQERIEAERQYYLSANGKNYCLDFALFCQNGNIDVECDGDRWHLDKQRVPEDNARNNDLGSDGWTVLRFSTAQLRDDLPNCIQVIRETANRYGGVVTPEGELRYFAQGTDRHTQLNLFQETPEEYETRPDTGELS